MSDKAGIHSKVAETITIAPQIVLEIKSEIAKLIELEKAALGVSADYVHKIPSAKTGIPRSRFTTHAPTGKDPMQPSENINDDDLIALTMTAIEDSYKSRWQSLSVVKKKNRIQDFVAEDVRNRGLSSERNKELYDLLYDKLMISKTLKAKDLEYDESLGKILKINGLDFVDDTFVINRATTKADQAAQTAIEPAVPRPLALPPKVPARSKIEKTMARIKRA